ncbi:MAG: phosphatase PAP2 family protein [Proteobacteria bacterium]|nr:phosphatase PAP2 family protein [Pseudomonadota bacterium]
MRFWSAEWPWFGLLIFYSVRLLYLKDWPRIFRLLWIGATIGLSDVLAHNVLKPWLGRLRPCRVESLVRVVNACSGWFSLPSNHASNAAVFAVLCYLLFNRRLGCLAFSCAIMIGLSRVYLGVHYPSDVLAGLLFGSFLALASNFLLQQLPYLKRWPLVKTQK